MTEKTTTSRPVGAVLHSAVFYDVTVWFATFGRERAFREKILSLVSPQAGETVVDIGCGTGTLAVLAKRAVGPTGQVCGIDASPAMIARARSKAQKAGVDLRFQNAAAQALPFPDASFDVALSTLMLHHLGRNARRQLACEMRRVIKPGGRVLVVDFARSTRQRRRLLAHFHHGHGHVDLQEIVGLLRAADFDNVESGAVGIKELQYALARAPQY